MAYDLRLTVDPMEAYAFMMALYEANDFTFEKLVPWLREHASR